MKARYTSSEVARGLGVSTQTIHRLRNLGKLRGERLHDTGHWYYLADDLKQYASTEQVTIDWAAMEEETGEG